METVVATWEITVWECCLRIVCHLQRYSHWFFVFWRERSRAITAAAVTHAHVLDNTAALAHAHRHAITARSRSRKTDFHANKTVSQVTKADSTATKKDSGVISINSQATKTDA